MMVKETDEHLLKKYHIPSMGDYSQPGSVLCSILQRLDTNKRLDESDKKWIRDKGMFTFYKFLENWENTGKPNFNDIIPYTSPVRDRNIQYTRDSSKSTRNTLPSINTQKNDDNKSKRNTPNPKNKQSIYSIFLMNLRKPHMALHYKLAQLNKHIESNIEGIVPSTTPEDISSIFQEKIWDTMHKSIQKDVEELFKVYSIHQWTATSIMAVRLLEIVLKVHLNHDLKEENINSMGDAINKLKDHNYDPSLLKELNIYKEKRNSYVHGNIRASAGEAKELIVVITAITMIIHNIKP